MLTAKHIQVGEGMSAWLVVVLMGLPLMIAALALQTLRLWRGQAEVARRMEIGLGAAPLRPDVRRGVVRGAAAQMLALVFLLGAGITAHLAQSTWHGGSKITPLSMTAVGALVGLVVSVGLLLSVIWFNKPGLIVPPFMRDELGVRPARKAMREV